MAVFPELHFACPSVEIAAAVLTLDPTSRCLFRATLPFGTFLGSWDREAEPFQPTAPQANRRFYPEPETDLLWGS